ncbi:MAG: D-alanine--D-alanine ligase [Alistipes sp.]|nr:D-alanine--D-alanine ligase [Alistipes sp.]
MNRLKIALLAGGNSSERGIALQSARQIYEALDKDKYDIKVVDVHGRDWEYESPDGKRYPLDKNDFSLTVNGERTEFDYALIIIHGTPGEDGKLQGYLDIMGIPYSSCSATSSVITFDKISTKRAVASRGIRVAKDMLLYKGDSADADEIVARLGLPLFVKPNASGSSFGVTKVRSKEDIAKAVADAFAESDEVLIEEFIEGREMACGVMIAGGKEYLFPVTEVISKNDFFDYEAKYTAGMSDEITPADITPELKTELNKMTLDAYKVCRCRGVVRIDFIVASDGRPCLIEVNAIPGMSSGSIVPKQARAMGMSLGQLFDTVIADTCGKSDDAI